MYFTPEAKYEGMRESVSHKLDIPLVNSSKKVWRNSTQNKAPTSPFQIGDYLRYTNEGHNGMVELVDVNTNDPDSIKYIIKFLRVNKMVVTEELLKSRNVTAIESIPIYSEDYINESNNLTQENIQNIMFPEVLPPLQQEFKPWHEKLSHLQPNTCLD